MKTHIVKAEVTSEQKVMLQKMAEACKRSVKKQVEWIIAKALDSKEN